MHAVKFFNALQPQLGNTIDVSNLWLLRPRLCQASTARELACATYGHFSIDGWSERACCASCHIRSETKESGSALPHESGAPVKPTAKQNQFLCNAKPDLHCGEATRCNKEKNETSRSAKLHGVLCPTTQVGGRQDFGVQREFVRPCRGLHNARATLRFVHPLRCFVASGDQRLFLVTLLYHFSLHASYEAKAPLARTETEKIFMSTPPSSGAAAVTAAPRLPWHFLSVDAAAALCARKCADSSSVGAENRNHVSCSFGNGSVEAVFGMSKQRSHEVVHFGRIRHCASRCADLFRQLRDLGQSIGTVSSARRTRCNSCDKPSAKLAFGRNPDELSHVCLGLLQLYLGEHDLSLCDKPVRTSHHEPLGLLQDISWHTSFGADARRVLPVHP